LEIIIITIILCNTKDTKQTTSKFPLLKYIILISIHENYHPMIMSTMDVMKLLSVLLLLEEKKKNVFHAYYFLPNWRVCNSHLLLPPNRFSPNWHHHFLRHSKISLETIPNRTLYKAIIAKTTCLYDSYSVYQLSTPVNSTGELLR